MSDNKIKPSLLTAFTAVTEAAKPAAASARAALPPPRSNRSVEGEPAARPKSPPGQGERITLTYRATLPHWERLKHLAISDRTSIQELIHTALSREFERRGLAALDD